MKKLLAALAMATALTSAASAADLPRRAAPPPVFTPVPVFTWTGFYAGFNAGYAFDLSDDTFGGSEGVSTGSRSHRDGFAGGGQIGYNYQLTPGSGIVVGVEADAQYVDFGRDRRTFLSSTNVGTPSLDFFGNVRGRLGYAFDRVLFYGTGGFAYGSGDNRLNNSRSNDDFLTGWTAGGGIEYALPTDSFLNFFRSSAVTLKAEFLYVNLDRNTRFGDTVSTPTRRDTEFAVVRGGLNYKFGTY